MNQNQNNSIAGLTNIRLFSPAAFIVAFLGFFLTFTDINCNGQKLDSVSGFEFVKGYSSDLDESGNEAPAVEKYNPNVFALTAFLAAIAGIIFYFVKKIRVNYSIMTLTGLIGFLTMILFLIDLKNKISSIDPDKNLNTDTYVNLEAEMKFGYWLVTFCFLMAAAWNYLKGKEVSSRHASVENVPESTGDDGTDKSIDQL